MHPKLPHLLRWELVSVTGFPDRLKYPRALIGLLLSTCEFWLAERLAEESRANALLQTEEKKKAKCFGIPGARAPLSGSARWEAREKKKPTLRARAPACVCVCFFRLRCIGNSFAPVTFCVYFLSSAHVRVGLWHLDSFRCASHGQL